MFIISYLIDFVIDFYNTNTFIMDHILDRGSCRHVIKYNI